MSAAGRFVVGIDFLLSVDFPAEAHYNITERQFESRLCGTPRPAKNDAICEKQSQPMLGLQGS
jgi:hypothetical protein